MRYLFLTCLLASCAHFRAKPKEDNKLILRLNELQEQINQLRDELYERP